MMSSSPPWVLTVRAAASSNVRLSMRHDGTVSFMPASSPQMPVGITLDFSKPSDNAYVESFNATVRLDSRKSKTQSLNLQQPFPQFQHHAERSAYLVSFGLRSRQFA
jgi:hypothetical protein